jgi:putative inorganic carbon (HCO3(-)) transporter
MKKGESTLARINRSVVKYDWLALALLLPLVIIPRPITIVVLLIIPLLWLMRKLGSGRFVINTPADWAILVLLVMLLVSLFATYDLAFSLPRVISIVYGIAVFFAAAAFASRSQKHLFWGATALLICGVIVALASLLGTQWTAKLPFLLAITDRLPILIRLEAAPAGFSPNQVAGTLLWVLPLFIAFTATGLYEARMPSEGTAAPRWAVLLVAAGALVVLGTTLLTQSRSGFAGLAAALFFMALAVRRSRPLALLATALIVLMLLVSPWARPLSEYFVGATRVAESDLPGEAFAFGVDSLEGRFEIWSRALYGLEDFPFTGMGVGTFRHVVPVLYPLFIISPSIDIAHAHNHLLQTGLDLGLPGLVAYLAIWLSAGAMLWQSWRLRQSRWQGALVIGLAGALVGYFVYGTSDAVALGARPGFIFWLMLGLIAGAHRWLNHIRQTAR